MKKIFFKSPYVCKAYDQSETLRNKINDFLQATGHQ